MIYPRGRTMKETHSKTQMWVFLVKSNLGSVVTRKNSRILWPKKGKGNSCPHIRVSLDPIPGSAQTLYSRRRTNKKKKPPRR